MHRSLVGLHERMCLVEVVMIRVVMDYDVDIELLMLGAQKLLRNSAAPLYHGMAPALLLILPLLLVVHIYLYAK